jgi:hypothetical protein
MANTDNRMSFIADGAITEYAVVSMTAAGKVSVTTAATDNKVVGVAQRACADGESVDVIVHGITRVIASEALDETKCILSATTAGKLQPCESGDTTFYPIARLLPNINQIDVSANEQFFAYFFGPSSLNA